MAEQNFDWILVSIATNANQIKKALKAGFPMEFERKKDQDAKSKRYLHQAGESKGLRLQRTDRAGNVQVDGGNLIWGKGGVHNTNLATFLDDLGRMGYGLVKLYVRQKEGELNGKGFVRFVFCHEDALGNQEWLEPTDEQEKIMDFHLRRSYNKLHGFRNTTPLPNPDPGDMPTPNITLNLSGPIIIEDGKMCEEKAFQRDLRIQDRNGHFRRPLHDVGAPALYERLKTEATSAQA